MRFFRTRSVAGFFCITRLTSVPHLAAAMASSHSEARVAWTPLRMRQVYCGLHAEVVDFADRSVIYLGATHVNFMPQMFYS